MANGKRAKISFKTREAIFLRSQGKCCDCGKPCDGRWHFTHRGYDAGFQFSGTHEIHHIIPVRKNGTNELKNLVFLCLECHRIRHEIREAEDGKQG